MQSTAIDYDASQYILSSIIAISVFVQEIPTATGTSTATNTPTAIGTSATTNPQTTTNTQTTTEMSTLIELATKDFSSQEMKDVLLALINQNIELNNEVRALRDEVKQFRSK